MNQVVIIFVPVGPSQSDVEAALRKLFAQLQFVEASPSANNARAEITDNDQWPSWTWFIPNPCR